MNEKKVRILVYSDIHHDEYQNGLTGDDVASIELQFTNLINQRSCNSWIFAGDRFASRNPYDMTKYRADRALVDRDAMTDASVSGTLVVGNHDQWKKNANLGHSMLGVQWISGRSLVVDTVQSNVIVQTKPNIYADVIPAGFENSLPTSFQPKVDDESMHIAIYHGMILGSKYQNGMTADHGWNASILNSGKYDLVICGDNHMHQKLPQIDKTPAWYVGAPMQHNWGDAGAKRGFMYFEWSKRTGLEYEFIEAKYPKFMKLEATISSSAELTKWVMSNKDLMEDNIIRVDVRSSNDVLSKLDTEQAHKAAKKFGARLCEFKPRFDNTTYTVVSSNHPVNDVDVWNDYVKSYGSTMDDIDLTTLTTMANTYLND